MSPETIKKHIQWLAEGGVESVTVTWKKPSGWTSITLFELDGKERYCVNNLVTEADTWQKYFKENNWTEELESIAHLTNEEKAEYFEKKQQWAVDPIPVEKSQRIGL